MTGKTGARDATLDRPNAALALGVPAAAKRLERVLSSGDRALGALLRLRPELGFLREFRSTLDEELGRLFDGSCCLPGSALS